MINVSYTAWGKKFTEHFEPGDYDGAFACARKLVADGKKVTIEDESA